MPLFILIRHGQTTWNVETRYQGQLDTPLTPLGLRQADAVAQRLSCHHFVAIYSSPLSRAYQTAERLSELHNLPIRIEQDLIEINHGSWCGLTKDEIRARYPEQYWLWKNTPLLANIPEGENISQVATRTQMVLERIAARYPDGTIAIITHDVVVRLAVAVLLGLDLNATPRIVISNGSLSLLKWGNDERRLICLNDTSHCAALTKSDTWDG